MFLFKRQRRPLSAADTAWLRMDDPTNLMLITGVFVFDEIMDFDRLRELVETRLLTFDRFRQSVVQSALALRPAYWEFDLQFDLRSHLHRLALPAPVGQEELQQLVSDLMSTPLDRSKPLWQFHLVENFGKGSTLICCLHHCIGDGIALARLLLALTDDSADRPSPAADGQQPAGLRCPGLIRRLAWPVLRVPIIANRLIDEGISLLAEPAKASKAAQTAAGSGPAFGRLLLPPDPMTPFKGPLGVRKQCAWSRPLPLVTVKAIGRAAGATINDVLMTAVSGALGRYLRGLGEPIAGLDVRAVVPVNLRPDDGKLALGNAFGLVFLSLPVGIASSLERLHELKRRMDALKATPEALVAFSILNAIGAAPAAV